MRHQSLVKLFRAKSVVQIRNVASKKDHNPESCKHRPLLPQRNLVLQGRVSKRKRADHSNANGNPKLVLEADFSEENEDEWKSSLQPRDHRFKFRESRGRGGGIISPIVSTPMPLRRGGHMQERGAVLAGVMMMVMMMMMLRRPRKIRWVFGPMRAFIPG